MDLKRTGRLLTVTALAASTALSGPLSALAQEAETPPPLIQDAPPEVPAERAPEPEAAPAPEPAPAPEAAPAPEPEAAPTPGPEAPAAREPEAAPAAEPEAPAERPAPPAEPEPAPVPEAPAEPVQAAPDSGPPVNAPEGNPAELPADAGTQNDLSNGADAPAAPATPSPEPAPAEPAPVAPAAPPAPATEAQPTPPATVTPATPPAGAGETPAAPPTPTPDAQPPAPPIPGSEPVAPAANPGEPPTAPTDPALRAPDGAPVAPGTPPAPPAPAGAVPAPLPGAAPGQPGAAPAPAPAPAQQSGALAPPPAPNPQPVAADIQTAPVPEGGVGASDARVQQLAAPVEVRPITAEQGQRLEAAPQVVLPNNVQVIERVGDRDILSLVGAGVAGAAVGAAAAYFIRSDDSDRLVGNSREVYYEQLPRGLTRQVISRPNGVQVITIENEYGDVIQRSRIAPDGRETVLFYDPYAEDDQRPDYYADAGADLPPLRLEIPEDRYIVDVSEPDETLYYDTIVAPPVETVERIYSLNEVRRSPRIRDKVRRIDLNTINFGFGSAEIQQSEVENLQALADAVKRVVDQNPGEVFLLEGHTDAVGSNVANLALSDRRAEAVASALSQYFEIPSENLVTQGYGEEDLKVDTQAANRENRRVTLRRITPLVKPVQTSQAN